VVATRSSIPRLPQANTPFYIFVCSAHFANLGYLSDPFSSTSFFEASFTCYALKNGLKMERRRPRVHKSIDSAEEHAFDMRFLRWSNDHRLYALGWGVPTLPRCLMPPELVRWVPTSNCLECSRTWGLPSIFLWLALALGHVDVRRRVEDGCFNDERTRVKRPGLDAVRGMADSMHRGAPQTVLLTYLLTYLLTLEPY
jgi:hypothetical protein